MMTLGLLTWVDLMHLETVFGFLRLHAYNVEFCVQIVHFFTFSLALLFLINVEWLFMLAVR